MFYEEQAEMQTRYITSSYSYGQEDSSVILYVPLPNANRISDNQYELDVRPRSIQLDIYNHEGINYHFGIKQLYGQVIPEKTKIKFKKSQIVISLSKYEYGRNWPDIRLKKSNDMYHDIKRADRRNDSSKDASTEALKAAMENVIEANDEQSKQLKKTIANAQQRVLNDMNLFVVPERKDQH